MKWLPVNTDGKLLNSLTIYLISTLTCQVAYANPELDKVVNGNVVVNQSGSTTEVNQASQQAIIDWKSFNIGENETTHFNQPAGGVALNRIDANQGASQIYGHLTSTGKVILVNGAGIHFGATAKVDVGNLVASTSGISASNFLAGKYIFDEPSSYQGSIVNEGSIKTADHGLVALLGTSIVNHGVIQAELGAIALGSGNKFTVDFNGDQLINFSVDEASTQPGVDSTGAQLENGINNTGALLADGGKILVSAKTAEGVLDNVINMSGVAQAETIDNHAGEIILSGGYSGTVNVTGQLNASSTKMPYTAGDIKILGNVVHLGSTAKIDASGELGGGSILVGGNMQGKGPEQNALTTTVDAGAILNANGLSSGNGGKVIVWSNGATQVHGDIFAKGGELSGNGGFIETSGHHLDISGSHEVTLANKGLTGTWLLDPTDVTITAGADSNVTNSGGVYQPTDGALDSSNIDASNLMAALDLSNITVTTTPVSGTGGGGTGDIAVDSPLTWTSENTLTLNAQRNIYLNADITAINGGLTLSAVNGAQSLATGTIGSGPIGGLVGSVTANINVMNFTLSQGQWFQSATTLPTFNVSNFNIPVNSVAFNGYFNGQFTRINTTGGINGIQDVFGLQGVATGPLSTNYKLLNNIDASSTSSWFDGAGFVSIGFASTNTPLPYSGVFDGQNFSVSNLSQGDAGGVFGGLFGSSSGTIQNINVSANIDVAQDTTNTTYTAVGILVGENSGTVSNATSSGTITASLNNNTSYIGGLVGRNTGILTNGHSSANVSLKVSGNPVINVGSVYGLNVGGVVTNAGATTSGGVGTNMLTVQSTSPSVTWTIYGVNSGGISQSNANNPITFADFQSLTGGSSNNTFHITTGSISGVINGGSGGNNTLAFDTPVTINIGNGTTTINGVSFSFTGIQNFNGVFAPIFLSSQQSAIIAGSVGNFGTTSDTAGGMSSTEAAMNSVTQAMATLTQSVTTMGNQMSQGDTDFTNSQSVNPNC